MRPQLRRRRPLPHQSVPDVGVRIEPIGAIECGGAADSAVACFSRRSKHILRIVEDGSGLRAAGRRTYSSNRRMAAAVPVGLIPWTDSPGTTRSSASGSRS